MLLPEFLKIKNGVIINCLLTEFMPRNNLFCTLIFLEIGKIWNSGKDFVNSSPITQFFLMVLLITSFCSFFLPFSVLKRISENRSTVRWIRDFM
jgi:hypothetical protein